MSVRMSKKSGVQEVIYAHNDRVMALDEGKLYKAKIIKVNDVDGKRHYFIHYDGWSRKHDRWAESKILAPISDSKKVEALQQLADNFLQFGKTKTDSSTNSSSKPTIGSTKKTRGKVVADSNEDEDDSQSNPTLPPVASMNDTNLDQLVRERRRRIAEYASQSIDFDVDKPRHALGNIVELPVSLKKHVVDEWAVITKPPYRLLQLPKTKADCVEGIIEEYIASKEVGGKVEELLQGLLTYFNQAVPSLFLYVHEQEQLDKITQLCAPKQGIDGEYCRIYGVEHLIRFFGTSCVCVCVHVFVCVW
ncbi:hypothetical protein EON63_00985 [archaeon]|nr:MAG: hypothetical protein EON63_00985 [archaeon]